MKKNVLLTGANGDIGFAIAKRLAQEKYTIIAFTHTKKRLAELTDLGKKYKIKMELINIDLSRPNNIKRAFEGIKQKYSSLYALINNAGIYPIISFEDYNLQLWNSVLTVNLTAPFLCIKYALPLMKKNGGRIINISSTGAHLGSRDVGYSASKAGLIGLTKSTARSLAQYNIRVNALAPGTIDTTMSRRMKEEDREKNKEASLIKRLGVPEDIVGAISFLLSNDSDYITGVTLDINGGLYIR